MNGAITTLDKDFDIVITGSGFAGSLMAMVVKQLGLRVILLEKYKHPRFAIGESSTPLTNLLLEELVTEYHLPRILPLTKWGSWQRSYPEIGCGLKRGFSFYYHKFGRAFEENPDRSDQLLVTASPHDQIADTHWYRADFDHFLVKEAERMGVEYLDGANVDEISLREDGVTLNGNRHGQSFAFHASFLIDATGPRGLLHRLLKLPELPMQYLPPTEGLFTHFTDVKRMSEIGNHSPDEQPPYPVDDAAMHHVFEGGWIWILRFNNGITSAGVAARAPLGQEFRFSEGAPAWENFLRQLPTVEEQFRSAKIEFPFVYAPRLSFRSGSVTGRQWALLPSAAGFVDPLLSTGFPLTLLGIKRLAAAIKQDWGSKKFDVRLKEFERQTMAELSVTECLVAALYANMNDFSLFTSLSLLYFAAASFTEAARRLKKTNIAQSFLLGDHPVFAPILKALCERALQRPTAPERIQLRKDIGRAIEPFDIAGLSDFSRRNWYPVLASDLLGAANKIGISKQEIQNLLERTGFYARL